jgi:hypothetical protein
MKEVRNIYNIHYETLMKEIKVNRINGKTAHVHYWRIDMGKITILSKVMYRVSAIPIKMPMKY